MATAIRFDSGVVRKAEITPEGYLRAEAVFARDGILEYQTPSGQTRKELRLPEENQKALTSFGLKPISLEHPPELINSQNSQNYSVGLSDSTVIYDQGGFVRGVITVLNSEAVESIKRGDALEISAGYECDVDNTPGVWRGQRYDSIQRNIRVNHIACTSKGRAGSEVKINFDSKHTDIGFQINSDSIQPKKNMARITLDSVTYEDVPEVLASVIGAKITALEKTASRVDSLETEKADLTAKLAAAIEERDRNAGRADGYEEIVTEAVPILEEEGYKWNPDKMAFVADMADPAMMKKKKKKKMEEEEEYDDEDDEEKYDMDEEDEEKEDMMPPKRKDSVAHLLDTWKKAETLGFGRERYDSALSASDLHRQAIAEYLPDEDLTGLSDSYVEGIFDGLYLQQSEEEEQRTDSVRTDSTTDLQDMIAFARQTSGKQKAVDKEQSEQIANAWKQPLSLSK